MFRADETTAGIPCARTEELALLREPLRAAAAETDRWFRGVWRN